MITVLIEEISRKERRETHRTYRDINQGLFGKGLNYHESKNGTVNRINMIKIIPILA
jgi:hypothetical protein